ncbi:MAG: type II toxin-antitoxin system VapC family toxin [Vulcanimicrobiaceae bacterium]
MRAAPTGRRCARGDRVLNGYLLDTNVVSEVQRGSPDPSVARWLRDRRHRPVFISVITLGEIRRGIEMQPDEHRRAQLQLALEHIRTSFLRRSIAIDGQVADRWGRITASNPNLGRRSIDALLAATALERDLILVTRNVRDFDSLGVDLVNPWTP